MKSLLTVLFAGNPLPHAFDPVFGGASAFDRALAWAHGVSGSVQTVIFTDDTNRAQAEKALSGKKNVSLVQHASWTNALVAKEIVAACTAHKADFAVFAWADLPFLNAALTKELIETHTNYIAEYTFADGYTNVLFPTSPVLLISLSMIGVDYFKWVKKSVPLFVVNLALVIGLIALGIVLGY